MRTANRATRGLLQDFLERDLETQRVQLLNDSDRTVVAHRAQPEESPFERIELHHVQRQQMNLVIAVESTELHPRDQSDSRAFRSITRRWDAGDRIVVRQRQRGNTAALSGFDYTFRWKSAVRGGRVRMQVDERRPTRPGAHRS